MRSFSADELRTISDGVHAMYCARNLAALCEQTFRLLSSVIPNEIALFDERSFRGGGWCAQFARLMEVDLGDLDPDSSSPDDSKCGVRVVTGPNDRPLPFSPRGRFVLKLVQPHFVRAKQLLEKAPAAVESVRPATVQPIDLTPREQEVLYWVSEGKTNSQIGIILNASSRTIQKHLEHIFQKLGVETRTSATVRAIEMGLLATISMAMG